MDLSLPEHERKEARHGAARQSTSPSIRPARFGETAALEALIASSARRLGRGYYTERETEAAIEHVFGVDSDLVADATYLVAEDDGGIVGCGGWSRRRTLFGGDRFAARETGYLDPAVDAARIRAFFVAPSAARRGVGSALLDACEAAAAAAGFSATALMATLPGVPFYARHGYRPDAAVTLDLGGVDVRFVPMRKPLATFDRQPALAGTVLLRPLAPDDWQALFAVAADPLLWAGHPASDRWQEPVFRGFFAAALASGGALVAIDPATGVVIGSSRYDSERVEPGEIEIGWTFLARRYWGSPANAAMKALMIRHALGHYDRVVFVVGAENIRSRRAMEKIGGVLTGRTPVFDMRGIAVPHVVYAIDPAGFASGPLRRLLPA